MSLFQHYNESILRESEDIPGFIITKRNDKSPRYAVDTLVTADSQRKQITHRHSSNCIDRIFILIFYGLTIF